MPFPFPVIPGNNNVSFPIPKFGNEISIPVPKNWELTFHSRCRSQKLGMQFFIPVPVPKVWEWAEPFPFPFPNVQKSFPLTPDLDCPHLDYPQLDQLHFDQTGVVKFFDHPNFKNHECTLKFFCVFKIKTKRLGY